MTQDSELMKQLEQVYGQLLHILHQLELAGVSPQPGIGAEWIDGEAVMKELKISQRTLQTLRDNKTLGHTVVGRKYYYRANEIRSLLSNNYVMADLRRLGKDK